MSVPAAARYAIVKGLELACALTHPLQRMPVVRNYARCVLAHWSGELEDRWETGAWTKTGPPEP